MYNAKLAVALKHSGKVLREFGDKVYVPFGAEYTILIKNMNSVRAQVTVHIDDNDVGDGTKFIIEPNDSVEIERFIKNGNLKAGNRFKFIERTGNIEEHRGIDVEDGLIRVEFQFERKLSVGEILRDYDKVCPSPNPWPYRPPQIWYGSDSGNPPPFGGAQYTTCSNSMGTLRGIADGNITANFVQTSESCGDFIEQEAEDNETGITVPGSVSEQEFRTVSSFPVESESHVIILQMLGETEDNRRVRKPVTVKAKPKCTTCGRRNKATAKFCTECGTSLTIV